SPEGPPQEAVRAPALPPPEEVARAPLREPPPWPRGGRLWPPASPPSSWARPSSPPAPRPARRWASRRWRTDRRRGWTSWASQPPRRGRNGRRLVGPQRRRRHAEEVEDGVPDVKARPEPQLAPRLRPVRNAQKSQKVKEVRRRVEDLRHPQRARHRVGHERG